MDDEKFYVFSNELVDILISRAERLRDWGQLPFVRKTDFDIRMNNVQVVLDEIKKLFYEREKRNG